jgi:hypothetical protein
MPVRAIGPESGDRPMKLENLSDAEVLQQCATADDIRRLWREVVRRFGWNIARYVLFAYQQEVGPAVTLSNTEKAKITEELVKRVFLKLLEDNRAVLKLFRGKKDEDVLFFFIKVIIAVVAEYIGTELITPDGPITLIEWLRMDIEDEESDSGESPPFEEDSDSETDATRASRFSRALKKLWVTIRGKPPDA